MIWQEIMYLLTYFLIYSFCGWGLESITKTVAQKKFINSGFLYGPVCPIYGSGAVLMLLLLGSFRGNYVLTFVVSFIFFSMWEYFVGWLLEKLFNTKYWDYSYYKFQINGRVCLANSLTWGFLGVAFIEIIHPIFKVLLETLSVSAINFCTIGFTIILIVDFIFTCIKIKNINIKMKKFTEITETIKEKAEELKEKAANKDRINEVIEELKQKQLELRDKIEKQTIRLREAIPSSIIAKRVNEFLKEKVEFKKKDKTK